MSKEKYIFCGIVFMIIAVLSYAYVICVSLSCGDVQLLLRDKMMFLLGMACVFTTALGLSEAMFVCAKIVPKWLRLLFYFQWIVAGVVIAMTTVYVLCVGNLR